MISFEEAVALISAEIAPIQGVETLPLQQALGRVLARDLCAARANPAFDNSAVDGYLLGKPAAEAGETFTLSGEIRAGSRPPWALPGRAGAVRIFTGAPIPHGDFAIVMQEDVEAAQDAVTLTEAAVPGAHFRRAGSDFESGTLLAGTGTRVGPAEIAFAAWNGQPELSVFREPRVAAVVTGDELAPLGDVIGEGQIYDSNGPMLEGLIAQTSPSNVTRARLPDDLDLTRNELRRLADSHDLIVISGGASVGDHDHIPAAIGSIGQTFFHKVSIKPGKPILFGKVGSSLVFGLPGNPASAFVCFEIFVRSALRKLSGETGAALRWVPAKYDCVHSPAPRDEFVRVKTELRDGELWAVPVFEQGSFGLRSLSGADALARLGSNRPYKAGDDVLLMFLPGAV